MPLPLDVLERSVNQKMSLQLKDGRVLEGKLVGFDQYMNLVLDDAEEKSETASRRLGTVLLRGNNVVSIAPEP